MAGLGDIVWSSVEEGISLRSKTFLPARRATTAQARAPFWKRGWQALKGTLISSGSTVPAQGKERRFGLAEGGGRQWVLAELVTSF